MNNKIRAIILGSLTSVLMSFNTYGMDGFSGRGGEGYLGRENYAEICPWGVGRGESLKNSLYQDIRNLGNVIPEVISQRDFKSVFKNMFAIVHGLMPNMGLGFIMKRKDDYEAINAGSSYVSAGGGRDDEKDEEAAKLTETEVGASPGEWGGGDLKSDALNLGLGAAEVQPEALRQEEISDDASLPPQYASMLSGGYAPPASQQPVAPSPAEEAQVPDPEVSESSASSAPLKETPVLAEDASEGDAPVSELASPVAPLDEVPAEGVQVPVEDAPDLAEDAPEEEDFND
ncbi:MAG: hypothetical protein LBU35_00335 [Holosporales bacterium]|jgi:hypothetical protein|nr:hypothetical protein [Holosporales bacterium]